MDAVRRKCYPGLVGCLAAVLSMPVIAQSTLTPEQLTVRVERMSESTQRTEAASATMQKQMKKLSDDVGRLGRLIDNRAMLDMIQQVDELSDEISRLHGEVEQQGHDIDDIKKRQRELYLDIDRRLRDLESGATTQAPVGSINIPKVEPSATLPTTQQQTTTTASISQTPSVTQSKEKAAYQAAFDKLKEGRYKKAKTELKSFLGKYPNSSFSGNAQYWLGEAHYVTRSFEQGIVEFEKVLVNYPTSKKVPDAMLKLGYTFYELKQIPQAKAILQDLRKRYPKATAASLAAKRLDRIRNEGY